MRSTEKQPDQDRLYHGDLRPHPWPLHPGHEDREDSGAHGGGENTCQGWTEHRDGRKYENTHEHVKDYYYILSSFSLFM